MYSIIKTKSYSPPPICESEILRYAGCKAVDDASRELLYNCLDELNDRLSFRVCYRELSVSIDGSLCDFELFKADSEKLASNLLGCDKVILFAASIGIEIDRLISRYSRVSPSKALMFQAIGAERIEALCDTFCAEIKSEMNTGLKPRFSPGYGDLPLDVQKDIFSVLDCGKHLGIALNSSLLMSPSKSVTAFAGLCAGVEKTINKCFSCNKFDCIYRCV